MTPACNPYKPIVYPSINPQTPHIPSSKHPILRHPSRSFHHLSTNSSSLLAVAPLGLSALRSSKRVLGESPRESLFTGDLLGADKRVDGDCNCAVDVLRCAVLGETHLAKGFGDTHDGFEVTDLYFN